jgi:hypothetical protein
MKDRKTIIVAAAFFAAAIVIALLLHALTGKTAAGSVSASGFPVSLNEIMSCNGSYYDERGNAYDWIELYNSSDLDLSLANYKLTDSERRVRFVFPADAEIAARGYYVIWCKSNDANEAYADFSISKSGGETLILMNSRSVIVDRVVTQALDQNAAMAPRKTAAGKSAATVRPATRTPSRDTPIISRHIRRSHRRSGSTR